MGTLKTGFKVTEWGFNFNWFQLIFGAPDEPTPVDPNDDNDSDPSKPSDDSSDTAGSNYDDDATETNDDDGDFPLVVLIVLAGIVVLLAWLFYIVYKTKRSKKCDDNSLTRKKGDDALPKLEPTEEATESSTGELKVDGIVRAVAEPGQSQEFDDSERKMSALSVAIAKMRRKEQEALDEHWA